MNKKTICLHLQAHLPLYLRNYRFFDMGVSHDYYDHFSTKDTLRRISELCFLPTNNILLDLIKKYKKSFKISISITGELIEQMEMYAPEVLDSFKALADTGCVEYICETYSHSLAFLHDEVEFKTQIERHKKTIKDHFDQTPKALRLTGLIYSNQIGDIAHRLGFKTMLTENARHIMAWKSPNYLYQNIDNKNLKLLLRNSDISDLITFNFSNSSIPQWPITCEKVLEKLDSYNKGENVFNLFLDYMALGGRHDKSTGIFEFFKHLPESLLDSGRYETLTVSEVAKKYPVVDTLDVPYPISWYEEECDLSVWLGNDLQKDAFRALCDMGNKVRFVNDPEITSDWSKLQDGDHFYFMCTRKQRDKLGRRKNPYNSVYDAYINYMNVLSDINQRINDLVTEKVNELMQEKKFVEKALKVISVSSDTIKYTPKQLDAIMELSNKHKSENV